jgi:quercetin dioxygenase-like cupin family protein
LHAHRDPECFYVLAGCIEVFLGDDERRWHPLGQGQSLLVAGGVKHAVRNTSNEPADTMVVTTVRLARFFREVAGPASGHGYRPPTSAELELIRRKAREHGYWLASPED